LARDGESGYSACPKGVQYPDKNAKPHFLETRERFYGKPFAEIRPKDGEAFEAAWGQLRRQLDVLAAMLKGQAGKDGPFFEGERASYADLMVVVVLGLVERTDKELWERILGIDQGQFKDLWQASLSRLEGQGNAKQ
jgi:glutathione S-transferase